MPARALEDFLKPFNKIVQYATLPAQDLLAVLAFLGKTSGGERPIALLGLVYRVLLALLRPSITAYDAAKAGFWDSVLKGRSALRYALLRGLRCELASHQGLEAVQVLLDSFHFYDSIDWNSLADILLEHELDLHVLVITMQVHLAPRGLRSQGHDISLLPRCNSVLPGCGAAVMLARMAIYTLLDSIHSRFPGMGPHQHVDDLSQVGIGIAAALKDLLALATVELAQGLIDLGFVISVKSTIVPANSPVAKYIAALLAAHGILVRLGDKERDVGLDASARVRRVCDVQKQRWAKGQSRGTQIGILARSNRKAFGLARAGALAQIKWGHMHMGFSERESMQLRSLFARCTGRKTQGRCTYTMVYMQVGPRGDPYYTTRLEALVAWLEVWHSLGHDERVLTAKAWQHDTTLLAASNTRRRRVRGLLSSTIACIYDMGWYPVGPDRWLDDLQQPHHFGPRPFDYSNLAEVLAVSIERISWIKASKHFEGSGLENGVDFIVFLKLRRGLRRAGLPQEAGLLEYIHQAGVWPATRLTRDREAELVFCPRCKRAPETFMHRYCRCPCNHDIEDSRVTDTTGLEAQALAAPEGERCFWARGLVPRPWVTPQLGVALDLDWQFADIEAEALDSVLLGSDGSGGHDPDARLAREASAGLQVASSSWGHHHLVGRVTYVPGRQTVPRAEVYGASHAVGLCHHYQSGLHFAHTLDLTRPYPVIIDRQLCH